MKFENGKRRFLYPTDMIHYFIQAYTLHSAEGSLNKQPRVGMPDDCEAKLAHVIEIADKCKNMTPAWAFDFDNFNGQHSFGDQAEIWQVLGDMYAA